MPASDRRRQFIDAAIQVIAREGVAKATTRRIAAAANAPAAALHCFSSKDELSRPFSTKGDSTGVRKAHATSFRAWAWRPASMPSCGIPRLDRQGSRHATGTVRADLRALRTPSAQHLPGRAYRDYASSVVQFLDTARRPEDPDVDFETLARQIIAVIDGHVLQSMSLGGDDLELIVEQACANIRDSFRSEAPAIWS